MAREVEGVRSAGLGPGSFPCLAILTISVSAKTIAAIPDRGHIAVGTTSLTNLPYRFLDAKEPSSREIDRDAETAFVCRVVGAPILCFQ
jgi:hypothetical protein